MDVIDRNGHQQYPIFIVHFVPGKGHVLRRVLRCTSNTVADVAVGVAAQKIDPRTGTTLKNRVAVLSVLRPSIGEEVFTYAYPKTIISLEPKNEIHFSPRFYDGRLEEVYPDGRDTCMMPAPCYRTSIALYSGASGGPVFGSHGAVFGINSSGIDGEQPAVSFVSRVNELFPLAIDDVVLPGDPAPSSVKIQELAERGFVVVVPPIKEVITAWKQRENKDARSIAFFIDRGK